MILIFDEPNLHLLENVSLCLSSFSNRRPGVRHSTFESLRLGRSSQSIAFGFLRFWNSLNFKKDKEFVGITVLFLDENVNSVIYGFTLVRRANHYMTSLKEGSIVKVDHFEVTRCSSMYTITDHSFPIRFISLTIIDEVITCTPEINLQSRLECSTIANFSNRRPGVRHSTFESLRLGRSSQSIAFGFLRFWDSLNFNKDKEFRDLWVTPIRRANHYMPSLKECSIVKVDHFEVARCSSMYTITDHPFLIRFISLTIIDEVITGAPEINLQSRLECSTIAK
ncbi:hypothetical protein F2Q70_00024781 [Brassica cretica]|uniref:Replication protein A 70 kDa DNA-binding subunit B/D first OB fold domain-containing protein n=1 Tax=Brassica cretica TaxID=69181 RepID=A0A8S9L965_BRACR|nr:hypothetical protein F2Q70_00024781 [Brassica cretica]